MKTSFARVPWIIAIALTSLTSACVDDGTPEDETGNGQTSSGGTSSGSGGGSASGGASSGGGSASGGGANDARPRVVGYLPTYRSLDPAALDLDTLTHLCIAFANPTGNGNEIDFDSKQGEIAPLVSAAHAKGVKVLGSIAGAARSGDVRAKIDPGNVDAFVTALLDFMNEYQLDGLDVDLEEGQGNFIDHTYEPFVKKLSAALPTDKLLTAAVATWHGQDFTDGALAEYDFINVMSYDHCGTWTEACEHSTPSGAQDELDYWVNERGLATDRVVLGVPFYGYCWGSACPSATLLHADIVSNWPSQASSDWFEGSGYQVSHNGPATIAAKSQLAKDYGGVMIWELGQDGTGENSLFQVIANAQ